MMSLTDKERLELLGEVFMDELKVIREYLSDIPLIKQDVLDLKVHMGKVEWRLENVEYAIQDHSHEIKLLKQRVA